jgi:hypothetical protein
MRYRVFLLLVANSVPVPRPTPAPTSRSRDVRRARPLQVEPRRTIIHHSLLPFVADVSVLRASVLPPSDRIAVHLQMYAADDPSSTFDQILHLRPNVLWPVAKIRAASGTITQVSVITDRRGRVRREYRVEQPVDNQLVVGHHGVTLDRVAADARGVELHGRAWHRAGGGRVFSALVQRNDIGYTFDLGKLGGHWLRMDVRGERLIGLSAVSEA